MDKHNPDPPPPHATTTSSGATGHALENLRSLLLKCAIASAPAKSLTPAQQTFIEKRIHESFPSIHTPDHPPYVSMIEKAIRELKEEGGSSEEAISEFIKKEYKDLPWAHAALLSHHLRKLSECRLLIKSHNGCYSIGEPTVVPPCTPAEPRLIRTTRRSLSPDPSLSSSPSSPSSSFNPSYASSDTSSSSFSLNEKPRKKRSYKKKRPRQRKQKARGVTIRPVSKRGRGRGRGQGRGRGRGRGRRNDNPCMHQESIGREYVMIEDESAEEDFQGNEPLQHVTTGYNCSRPSTSHGRPTRNICKRRTPVTRKRQGRPVTRGIQMRETVNHNMATEVERETQYANQLEQDEEDSLDDVIDEVCEQFKEERRRKQHLGIDDEAAEGNLEINEHHQVQENQELVGLQCQAEPSNNCSGKIIELLDLTEVGEQMVENEQPTEKQVLAREGRIAQIEIRDCSEGIQNESNQQSASHHTHIRNDVESLEMEPKFTDNLNEQRLEDGIEGSEGQSHTVQVQDGVSKKIIMDKICDKSNVDNNINLKETRKQDLMMDDEAAEGNLEIDEHHQVQENQASVGVQCQAEPSANCSGKITELLDLTEVGEQMVENEMQTEEQVKAREGHCSLIEIRDCCDGMQNERNQQSASHQTHIVNDVESLEMESKFTDNLNEQQLEESNFFKVKKGATEGHIQPEEDNVSEGQSHTVQVQDGVSKETIVDKICDKSNVDSNLDEQQLEHNECCADPTEKEVTGDQFEQQKVQSELNLVGNEPQLQEPNENEQEDQLKGGELEIIGQHNTGERECPGTEKEIEAFEVLKERSLLQTDQPEVVSEERRPEDSKQIEHCHEVKNLENENNEEKYPSDTDPHMQHQQVQKQQLEESKTSFSLEIAEHDQPSEASERMGTDNVVPSIEGSALSSLLEKTAFVLEHRKLRPRPAKFQSDKKEERLVLPSLEISSDTSQLRKLRPRPSRNEFTEVAKESEAARSKLRPRQDPAARRSSRP